MTLSRHCGPPVCPKTYFRVDQFSGGGSVVEIGQSSWLSAPDRPEQGGDKIDMLPLYQSNQISDDGARLIGVVRSVSDDCRPCNPRPPTRTHVSYQMFGVGCVERLARNVAVGGRIHFGVEIGQPDINPERR
jgi:hypothetical protein